MIIANKFPHCGEENHCCLPLNHPPTVDCRVQVDFLNLKNISSKLGVDLYGKAKIPTFNTE